MCLQIVFAKCNKNENIHKAPKTRNILILTVISDKSSVQKSVNVRNPGRDISFPIFTRKEIETKRIRKEIKAIISRLNHFLSFLSNI